MNLNSPAAIEGIVADSGASGDANLVRPRLADLQRGIVQRRCVAKIVNDIILDQIVKTVDVECAERPISERVVQDLRMVGFYRRISLRCSSGHLVR